MTKIKDMPIHERPIERMKKVGVKNLSDEELLSIVLKTGTFKVSVKELSIQLIAKIKKLSNLENISYEELKEIKGIGDSKASMIISIIEIAKRISLKEDINTIKITSPTIIYNHYKEYFRNLKQEEFHCIYLDNSKKIIKQTLLFKGTINRSIVHPREIFKEAYINSSSSIICIHNHPSGNVSPSKDDIDLTKKIKELGDIFDIKLVDHIIIGSDGYYSFLESMDIL